MNLQAIVISNCFGISLMAMLLVCAGKGLRRNDFAEKIFYGMIWATILLCALEMSSFLIDGRRFPAARALNYLLNTLVYAVNIICIYFWTLFTDYKLYEDMDRIRRRRVWTALPMLAVLGMLAVNLFSPVLFSISESNVYSRTPLTVLPYIVSFLYLGYSEWLVCTSRNNAKQYLSLPAVIFILPILAGSILQMLFYGLSITWAALSISVVSIYINVQSKYSAVDSLSGVYTRQYFDAWLKARMRGQQKPLVGIMTDLDRFKQINDTCGHLAGDQAIRDFGRLLRITADSRDIVARYGGDEFVLIREGESEAGLREFSRKLEKSVDEYNSASQQPFRLAFSAGYSAYVPGRDDMDGFLKKMDFSMYQVKKAKSGSLPDRRGRQFGSP